MMRLRPFTKRFGAGRDPSGPIIEFIGEITPVSYREETALKFTEQRINIKMCEFSPRLDS
jgi:hypothetical protein